MPNDYTVEIFKKDARCKTGEKLTAKKEFNNVERDWLETYCQKAITGKFRFEIYETWVVKKNLMSGIEYKERYDTPHFCSPSSETYWSM